MKAYPVVPKTFTTLILFLFLFSLSSFATVSADTWWTGSGSNAWSMYSSGNMGIGTASPTGVLQVNGVRKTANNQGQLLIVGASDHAYLQIRTTNSTTKETGIQLIGTGTIANPDWSIKEAANSSTLRFNYRGTDQVAIKSNGFVGIGTVNPATQFEVSNTGDSYLRIAGDSDNDGNEIGNAVLQFTT